ncbi:MAG: cytochrome c [Chloroflexi bacterium]|nr:cytochrome c [Chloroflexota bacterium]
MDHKGKAGQPRTRWLLLVLAIALAAVAGAGLWWGLAVRLPAARVNAQGRDAYATYCASCHGARGEGASNWKQQNEDKTYPAPPHDSTGHTWHHGDGTLYSMVRDGGRSFEGLGFKSGMPAFGDQLGPEGVRAVITYLRTFWGPEERRFQAEQSLRDPFP